MKVFDRKRKMQLLKMLKGMGVRSATDAYDRERIKGILRGRTNSTGPG